MMDEEQGRGIVEIPQGFVIAVSMAIISQRQPQYDANSIENIAESSIILSMRRIIQTQRTQSVSTEIEEVK